MENKANDLAARIRQLHSMVTLAKFIPISRRKEIEDLSCSLMLHVDPHTLSAETNAKLIKSIGKLKVFVEEEEERGEKLGQLKAEACESFIKAS